MDEVKIWSVDDALNVEPLARKRQADTETLLEETLVKNPDLMLPRLRLVGRQTPTEGGPLDLLGVDEDGRLVVFELKRGTLSRDAVAQIIDYASDLDSKSDVELAEHITANSGVGGIENIDDFEEWYTQNTEAEGLESLKPMRMFLVGLGADDRTERMVRFLAENSAMDISLLTFHGFAHEGKTLLARQIEVEAAAETGRPRRTRRYLSTAEREARLEAVVEESGTSGLFGEVRDMFRENWPGLIEYIGPTALGFHLGQRIESRWRTRSYARIYPDKGTVGIAFYGRTITLCRGQFDQAKKLMDFQTYRDPDDPEDTYAELNFTVDETQWETHKKRLDDLTQAVYLAWKIDSQQQDAP